MLTILAFITLVGPPPTPPELPELGPKNMPPIETEQETATPESVQPLDPSIREVRAVKSKQQSAGEAIQDAEATVLEMDIYMDQALFNLAQAHLNAYKLDLRPEHLHEALKALERIQNPTEDARHLLVEVRSKTTPGLDPFRRFVQDILTPELDPFRDHMAPPRCTDNGG